MVTSESAETSSEVFLHRRVALLRPGRVDVRPSPGAVIAPLSGFLMGVLAGVVIWFGMGTLPLWLLAVLLVIAVVGIPFAGIGTVYALVGAHVVVDRAKQSATWQQGFLGMGVGTTELVPFWKVDRIIVEEAGSSSADTGRPVEEFAQWRIVLVKKSGKRLDVGVASAARSLSDEAFERARAVAAAIAEMTGAPLEIAAWDVDEVTAEPDDDADVEPVSGSEELPDGPREVRA